jgi:hypothetical protein
MGHRFLIASGALLMLASAPAAAEVAASSDVGFVLHNEATVTASPDTAFAALAKPSDWWNAEHSYSGDAANMTIEPTAGGCFCEAIPEGGGSVEHMRVVYFDPRVRTLRLRGSLGPLQGEALTGTLTMTVEPAGTGSKIVWDYVVGGYARFSLTEFAPAVDGVVAEQLDRLAALLGPAK